MLCVVSVAGVILVALWLRGPAVRYRVTFLTSPGASRVKPDSINDHGQVVGTIRTVQGEWRMFLWDRDRGMQEFELFGQRQVGRLHINNAGQVAGTIFDPNGSRLAFLRGPRGETQILGSLGGSSTVTAGLNDRGQIVGSSQTAGGPEHAFLWDPANGMRDLGTLGGLASRACSINDRGQITGFSQTPDAEWHAFFWDPNAGMVDIGFGSSQSVAKCYINDNGFVVGDFSPAKDRRCISVWSREYGTRPLRPTTEWLVYVCPPNDRNEFFLRVYRPGYTVRGHRVFRRFDSYLWTPGKGFRLVRGLVSGRDIGRFEADEMNNDGQAVGMIMAEGERIGPQRGVVLEPME
jgi:probable HAF family extracellular repeat protein